MRGGVSCYSYMMPLKRLSSPHAWGCFYGIVLENLDSGVFPTCVGVFPISNVSKFIPFRLPHMRGGVSY